MMKSVFWLIDKNTLLVDKVRGQVETFSTGAS